MRVELAGKSSRDDCTSQYVGERGREVRSDDPDLASYLRIEERELEVGGRS